MKHVTQEIKLKIVACKTDREVMLCEQVLRMCRGEDSQADLFGSGKWHDVEQCILDLSINMNYRAKPKKELVVPWEWLDDCIYEVMLDESLKFWQRKKSDKVFNSRLYGIKLDFEGIDLPVTVKRPNA